jgi:UDP-N-acetylmuramate--alanine ligase
MVEKTLCSRTELMDELGRRDLDVVLTLGAGDIDQLVAPIERLLNERYRP